MSALLSAVVITPDNYGTVAAIMRCLHAQPNRGEIEILLCAVDRASAGPERPEWRDFAAVRIIETGPVRVIAEVKAAAVRSASAPVVAFTEEHSFPEPGWAHALIERHREPYAAVGPMLVNPNPRLAMSWANFVLEYGPWIDPPIPGTRRLLPGNNSSYKRDILLAYGDRLAAMLDAEILLHLDLACRGEALYLEPKAVTRHLNITRIEPFRWVSRNYARMFASRRCQDWSLPRKLVYGFGSPLIPLIRINRHWKDIQRGAGVPRHDPKFWAYLALALLECSWGEMLGYLAGPGDSREMIFEMEFHRTRHLDLADEFEQTPLAASERL